MSFSKADLMDLHTFLCARARDIIEKKNADYGATDDPFHNFRMAALLKLPPESGILLRMQDKMARIVSFLEKGNLRVTEESWEDSCVDLINYTVLLCGMLHEKVGESRPQVPPPTFDESDACMEVAEL